MSQTTDLSRRVAKYPSESSVAELAQQRAHPGLVLASSVRESFGERNHT